MLHKITDTLRLIFRDCRQESSVTELVGLAMISNQIEQLAALEMTGPQYSPLRSKLKALIDAMKIVVGGRRASGYCGVTISNTTTLIPTLSEWGTITLAGLLALGTFVAMRRRQV